MLVADDVTSTLGLSLLDLVNHGIDAASQIRPEQGAVLDPLRLGLLHRASARVLADVPPWQFDLEVPAAPIL